VSYRGTFESLRIWQDARRLTYDIYEATKSAGLIGDRSFKDQLRRAGLSVMSNIAEGYERDGHKEFLHFLRIAKGSAGEVRSQLFAAEDLGYLSAEVSNRLRLQAVILSREIAALIRHRSLP
jgi:four helix bundle protein